MGLIQPSGHQVICVGPGPSGLSQYYWASSPSYSLGVFILLDGQPELRLVEFLLPSRVPLTCTLEELIVLLICCFRVLRLELETVVEVSDRWGSERIKLLIEVTVCQLRVLLFRDASKLHFGVLPQNPKTPTL